MTRKRANPEEQFQRSVAQLLDSLGWMWWHTPNGGWRSSTEAKIFKGLGVKPGVADVIIAEPWELTNFAAMRCCQLPEAHGLPLPVGNMIAIELKIGRNRPTDSQSAWLGEVCARGWLAAFCHDIDEVMDICRMVKPLNGRRMQ